MRIEYSKVKLNNHNMPFVNERMKMLEFKLKGSVAMKREVNREREDNGLLVAERRSRILARLAEQGKVKVDELSIEFGVSEVTIRRDLSNLEKEGLIERTHGGAVSSSKSRFELSFEQKVAKNMIEKNRIAEKALSLIEDGDTIILDSGTTTFQLAKKLGSKRELTVVTNAINFVTELSAHSGLCLVLLGGIYKPATGATIGPLTNRTLKDLHVDKFFLGCNAFTISGGLMTADMADAETRKEMIKVASQVIVLADSTKFGKTSFVSVARIEEIDIVITDSGVDPQIVEDLQNRGVQVLLA